MADYNMAISLNPLNAVAYNNRGQLKSILHDTTGAIADWKKAIVCNPKNTIACENLSYWLLKMKDTMTAERNYDSLIKLQPDIPKWYILKAELRYLQEDYHTALEFINKAIDLNPQYGQAYLTRGLILRGLRQYNQGCDDFKLSYKIGIREAEGYIYKYCR